MVDAIDLPPSAEAVVSRPITGGLRVLAIVPAYNEADAIAGTLASLRQAVPDVDLLVVNDGSWDDTAAIARQAGAAVIDLPCNLGIGGAVQTGFKYAARQGYDLALQFDGDGQHLATEVPKLIAPLVAAEADVVLGSRFLGLESFRSTWMRRLGIRIFARVNSWLIRQPISDNTSGFRAYNRKAIAFLAAHYPTDYPEPEAVVLLARHGFALCEVPVAMQARQGGTSSITRLGAVYYMVKVLLAIGMARVRQPVKWRAP